MRRSRATRNPEVSVPPMSVVAVDGGDLPLGGGLLALVRPALSLLRTGGQLAVLSSAPSVAQDLPAWCRLEHHEYLGAEPATGGRTTHRIARGSLGIPRAPLDGGLSLPDRADPATGFAPPGAAVEPGGPFIRSPWSSPTTRCRPRSSWL